MSRRLAIAGMAAVVLAAVVAGCGYGLGGSAPHLPASATTIAIKLFANRTREHGLEVTLQRAIEEEFRRRGRLAVVEDPGGDLVLTGIIRNFGSTAVAFGVADEALRYQGVLRVGIRLRERASGRLLYHAPLLQETLDFAATPGVVVPSSPRFQQGTIDPRDLVLLTNTQLGEARRQEAMQQLVELLARDVYLQSMEGF